MMRCIEREKRYKEAVKGSRSGSRGKEGKTEPSPYARAGLRCSVGVHGEAKLTPNQKRKYKEKAEEETAYGEPVRTTGEER